LTSFGALRHLSGQCRKNPQVCCSNYEIVYFQG
jgi:hypothetical protein